MLNVNLQPFMAVLHAVIVNTDESTATRFSVFQQCHHKVFSIMQSISASPSASLMSECHICLLFVIVSNEGDNQLYIVMAHLNTA